MCHRERIIVWNHTFCCQLQRKRWASFLVICWGSNSFIGVILVLSPILSQHFSKIRDIQNANKFETVYVWRWRCHIYRYCSFGLCPDCFYGGDYVSICTGIAWKMESQAFLYWWQKTCLYWFCCGHFRKMVALVAFDNRDSRYIFILGWAKNPKVEMGAHRFFEFLNQQSNKTGADLGVPLYWSES